MKKEKEKIYTQYKGKHRKVKINNVCKYLKSKLATCVNTSNQKLK